MLISTVLSVLAWMSLSLTASSRLKMSYAVGLLFTACAIILVLFLGMIFGLLSLTYYAIIIGALIQALLRGWTLQDIKSKIGAKAGIFQTLQSSYILLYGVALCVLGLFAIKIYPDFIFFGWDEFSHWARYTKILINTSIAPVENPSVLFPAYPPGINLWHYYICGPGGYAEWKVIFAQSLLVTSAVLFISTAFDRLKGLGTLAVFAFGLMLYHAFGTTLYEIYTDSILGLLFGASLLTARELSLGEFTRAKAIGFAGLLATLSLIKPITFLFPLTTVGLFFGLRLVRLSLKRFSKKEAANAGDMPPVEWRSSFFQTAQFLMAGLSTVFIWKIYTSTKSVVDQLAASKDITFGSLYEFFITRDTEETQIAWTELGDRIGFERISNFGEKQFRLDAGFFETEFPIYHGAIFLLMIALGFILFRASLNYKKAIIPLAEALYLAVTFILYLFVIVFVIRHYFQPWDIAQLASLERYLSSFLLGILAFGFASAAVALTNLKWLKKENIQKLTLAPVWVAIAAYIIYIAPVTLDNVFAKSLEERPVPSVHHWANEYAEHSKIRNQVITLSNIVKANAKPEDRVYVIAQNETGFTFYMSGHELSPLGTNPNCFSVGPKYSDKDNITCDWMDFRATLLEYNYLILRRADEAFWDNYAALFDPSVKGTRSGVFKINWDGETLELETIYLSDKGLGPDCPIENCALEN